MKKIYLDNAASTQLYSEVINLITEIMKKNYGNPSSIHSMGQESKFLIEESRQNISEYIGATSKEIIFTSSGTESNNFIIRSCVEDLNIKSIITTKIEHKSISETIFYLRKKYPELELIFLPVNSYGEYSISKLEELLSQKYKKTLVTLMHSNNEIGNLVDLCKIGEICKKYNVLFHSDAVQTIGHIPIKLNEIPIDFISASAHKFHGPKGIGFVYINKLIKLNSLIKGGKQEKNLRGGTENLYGIIGMEKALEISLKNYQTNRLKIENIKSYTIQKLQENFPGVKFGGKSEFLNESLYTILNVLLPFKENLMSFKLDLKGILISQGSACNTHIINPFGIIKNFISKDEINLYTPLRISFSFKNTIEEIDYLIQSIQDIFLNK